MQKLQITINEVVKAKGNIDVPSSIAEVSIIAIQFNQNESKAVFNCALFLNETELGNNNPFLVEEEAAPHRPQSNGYFTSVSSLDGVTFNQDGTIDESGLVSMKENLKDVLVAKLGVTKSNLS